MTRQKLSFLIGFPLFGISIFFVPELLSISSIPEPLLYINIVPIIITFIYHTSPLSLPYDIVLQDYIDGVIHLSFFVIFWLPIGFVVNWCLEKYKTRKKQKLYSYMNKKLFYLAIGIFPTFFGFSYVANGLALLITDINAYPDPLVLVIGVWGPIAIGPPLVAIGVFLLWKSYKLFKKDKNSN